MKYVRVSLSEADIEELRLALDLLVAILEDAEYELGESNGSDHQ